VTGRITVAAPAKVNLFLHVTGRRSDGYHLLESLMAPLDFGDTVTLATRNDGAIVRVRDLPGIAPDDDLSIRAARALQREARCALGADIAIDKRIPQGSGLGGGSSDAASVLIALNALWQLHWSRERLIAIGTTLGADVAFFLGDGPAIARGIGERLTPVTLPSIWIALIVPPIHVPTASIFAAPELTRSTPSAKINVFSESYGRNDLQPIAAARYPVVAEALARLAATTNAARMTGSGACVFAPFAVEADARAACADCAAPMRGIVARTLARHPLATLA
jgi:4-diphosphocytidyl-2-C-methyl-D-erythritol kinase